MQIFLSYASEQKAIAEPIAFSLRKRGHQVFLDRDDLPAGQSFDDQIAAAIAASDFFIFLASPESVAKGRFTLTELQWARKKWPIADSNVLPVVVGAIRMEDVPSYLKSVTLLEPAGNIAAEVSAAVHERVAAPEAKMFVPRMAALCAVAGLVSGFLPILLEGRLASGYLDLEFANAKPFPIWISHSTIAPLYVPLIFVTAFYVGFARWSRLKLRRAWLLLILTVLGWLLAINMALDVPGLLGVQISFEDYESLQNAAKSSPDASKALASVDKVKAAAEATVVALGGMIAGATGALFTCLGLIYGTGGPRRSFSIALGVLTVIVGGLAGMLYSPEAWHYRAVGTFWLLFAVWQAAVGGMLAFLTANSRA